MAPCVRIDARASYGYTFDTNYLMSSPPETPPPAPGDQTAFRVLGALSVCHLLNDMVQSLLPSIYPILKTALRLDFGHIGLITLVNQLTASLLQPLVGSYTDRRPLPQSLAIGMSFTLAGLVLLAVSVHFGAVLVAATLIGIGSSVFHPESSRIARLASGGQHGLAQSLFQVGGNAGSAIGPLLAALIVLPRGQRSLLWFAVAPVVAIALLWRVGDWYRRRAPRQARATHAAHAPHHHLTPAQVKQALAILLVLVFSKYVYLASLSTYYTFYLIETFGVSVRSAQLHLFVFLGAVAAGTILGGPGRRSLRAQVRDLGINPWRAAVLGRAALREPCDDRDPERGHRPDPRLGLLGHPGLRAGAGAGQRRHDLGAVLRPGLRHRRPRRGRARRARRRHQHDGGLSRLRVAACAWLAHRMAARPGTAPRSTRVMPLSRFSHRDTEFTEASP